MTFLFLGFLVDSAYAKQLDQINPTLRALFIQKDKTYLQLIEHNGKSYLGKFVDSPTDLTVLELTQINICSLLNKLVPDYPCTLQLFSIISSK